MRKSVLAAALPIALVSLSGCRMLASGDASRVRTAPGQSEVAELSLSGLRPFATPDKVALSDVYLTNLPDDAFGPNADVSKLTGMLLHAHVLTRPRAGKTPIATSATTSTLRLLILANGEAGLYAGGGFADVDIDDKTTDGSVRRGTVRLVRATPGFSDILGPSTLSVRLDAPVDANRAEAANRLLGRVVSVLPLVADDDTGE